MNFIRRLIFNLVFFGFLFLFVLLFALAIAGKGGKEPTLLKERTTLIIAPDAKLVEQYSADQASRALSKALGKENTELQLRDLLRGLQIAKTDSNIERVFVNFDKLQLSGYGSLHEVTEALADLRESGKQVVAFSQGMSQGQYLLAAQANEVYLDPMGSVVLEGLSGYRQYFREGLQDKLGVDVHLFRVGEYKSAAEPFILDAASQEAKQADLFWMSDIWNRYLNDVGNARKISPSLISAHINNLPAEAVSVGGDLAKLALQQKLVDGLKTGHEVEQLLISRGVPESPKENEGGPGFRNITLTDYLKLQRVKSAALDKRSQVAVVVADGEISSDETVSERLRKARQDEKVKAVVLRVNSPGGEVFASETIRREVVALKSAGKPVVVSMGDLAASGGYWISMNADRIYANASTISGSIGIFGLVPNFTRTLEKIGVHTDGVGTTTMAGAFDPTKPLSPEMGTLIQSIINKGYADFTGLVASARNSTPSRIDEIARGRVWTGRQAMERGLVDELGGLNDAITEAAKLAKLGSASEYRVQYVEKKLSSFEKFLADIADNSAGQALLGRSEVMQGLLLKAMPHSSQQLKFVQRALEHKPGTKPVTELAYCFCGL